MADDALDKPDGGGRSRLTLSGRDVLDAINALRDETREARHAQANATQRAIADVEQRLGGRLAQIEMTIASANPTSLGPRLNAVEQWQTRMEVVQQEHARQADERQKQIDLGDARINALEAWRDQLSGVVKALSVLSVILGIISTALGIFAAITVAT